MQQKQQVFLIISIITLILSIILLACARPIFNYSIGLQIRMQQKSSSQSYINLQNTISYLVGTSAISGGVIFFLAFCKNKVQVFAYTILLVLQLLLMCFLKQLIQSPRPFWASPDIKLWSWTCLKDYGNPSGQSILAWTVLEYVLLNVIMTQLLNVENLIIKIGFYIALVICNLLVMYSRMYLGAHALNQVMFGSLLGFYTIVGFKLYLQEWLEKHIESSLFLQANERKKHFMYIIITMVGAFFIPVVIHAFQANSMDPQQPNWEQQIAAKCKIKISNASRLSMFQHKCLLDESWIGFLYGIIIGIYLQLNDKYLLGKFQYKISAVLGKICVLIVIYVIARIPEVITTIFTASSVIKRYFYLYIEQFFLGFFLAFFPPILLPLFRLIDIIPQQNDEDVQRYRELQNDRQKDQELYQYTQ